MFNLWYLIGFISMIIAKGMTSNSQLVMRLEKSSVERLSVFFMSYKTRLEKLSWFDDISEKYILKFKSV
jgi:hypothetical protein